MFSRLNSQQSFLCEMSKVSESIFKCWNVCFGVKASSPGLCGFNLNSLVLITVVPDDASVLSVPSSYSRFLFSAGSHTPSPVVSRL